MIEVPILSEEDLKQYKNKKVVIYKYSNRAKLLCRIFRDLDINVISICDKNRKATWRSSFRGIPIISVDSLEELNKKETIFVQLSFAELDQIECIKKELNQMGITYSDISSGRILTTYAAKYIIKDLQNPIIFALKRFRWLRSCNRKRNKRIDKFLEENHHNPIFICLPPKVGDTTLQDTFNKLNGDISLKTKDVRIDYLNVCHRPKMINHIISASNTEKVKIITGIREPIAQNLSMVYQDISSGDAIGDWILGEIESSSKSERYGIFKVLEELLVTNVKDAQKRFDFFISRYLHNKEYMKKEELSRTIQNFYMEFKKEIIDITQYPFNQEKGYTIIEVGKIEIFIYQIEKLNKIIPELSRWIGISFSSLESGNVASSKWIGESYKQACKEIQFNQEYFDSCYEESYVKHCYSKEDIEKFKERWRGHILHD